MNIKPIIHRHSEKTNLISKTSGVFFDFSKRSSPLTCKIRRTTPQLPRPAHSVNSKVQVQAESGAELTAIISIKNSSAHPRQSRESIISSTRRKKQLIRGTPIHPAITGTKSRDARVSPRTYIRNSAQSNKRT